MKAIRTALGALAVAATALTGLPGATAPAHAESENVTIYHSDGRVSHCGPLGNCNQVQRVRPRQWHGQRGYQHRPRHHYRHGGRVDDGTAAAILGITGLAIVGGALAHQNRTLPSHADPAYRHRSPRGGGAYYPPAPSGPNVITYESGLEPWSPGWYQWCDRRYRSFDPRRGTFRGYDGRDHFCVPR
ncbi:BA14K family protein [Oceaniradius stylonematis]|nr:BA14K family protein [Oceaniradius stylonematis]